MVNQLTPGECVSTDQYFSGTHGRLTNTTGGAIYYDHSSSVIQTVNQVGLTAAETLKGKNGWKQWARDQGVKIKEYHDDGGIFASREYQDDYRNRGQNFRFSGVGAHHQNGAAERSIRTIVEMARSMLLHAALHWPEEYYKDLWPLAMDHATYVWNNVPSATTGLSPIEIFSGCKFENHNHLLRLHV